MGARTRNVVKKQFMEIEKIEAETGVVKITMKDGRIRTLLPKQAAARALELNNIIRINDLPTTQAEVKLDRADVKHITELICTIRDACRKAAAQLEDPGNKDTQIVSNVANGLTMDGKDPSQVRSPFDIRVQAGLLKYPSLTKREIEIVYISEYSEAMQEEILAQEEDRRRAAFSSKSKT